MLSVVWSSARTPHAGVQLAVLEGVPRETADRWQSASCVNMAETAANWPLVLYTLDVRRIRCSLGDGVARRKQHRHRHRHRHCNSWGSSRRDAGESLRLGAMCSSSLSSRRSCGSASCSVASHVLLLVRDVDLRLPASLCELISSAG